MAFQLIVNGQSRIVDAPADMPLLWVIRDILNLRGTKYGCGISVCGACTVHINGEAARSCVTPIPALRESGSRPSKDSPAMAATRSNKRGWVWMSRNAATASRVRLCRRRHC